MRKLISLKLISLKVSYNFLISLVKSISYFLLGLGKLTFSIKKIANIKNTITINNFIIILINVFPKLGCLLYLSCIVLEFI